MPLSHRAAVLADICALSALSVLGACSPTFNWRELRPPGTPLLALMPCKPESATRPVPLLGEPVQLHMHSCKAGGLRFAVAWADVGSAAQVPVALGAWRSASLQAIRVLPSPADAAAQNWAVRVAGAPAAQGLSAQGLDPQGQPVQMRAAYFAQGTQVYQVALYGATLPSEATEAFFAGVRLSPT